MLHLWGTEENPRNCLLQLSDNATGPWADSTRFEIPSTNTTRFSLMEIKEPAYALYSPGPGDLSLVGGPKRAELPKPKEEQVRRSDCTWPPTLARSW